MSKVIQAAKAADYWAGMLNGPCILQWRFQDAPEALRALSPHGGDEDWLVVVPHEYAGIYMPWLQNIGRNTIGVCDTSEHDLGNGFIVYIGAHA